MLKEAKVLLKCRFKTERNIIYNAREQECEGFKIVP
jgi:hypothetical protein